MRSSQQALILDVEVVCKAPARRPNKAHTTYLDCLIPLASCTGYPKQPYLPKRLAIYPVGMSCSYTGPDGQKTLDVDASQIPSRDKASEGIEGFHFRIIRFFGHGQEVSDHVRPWPLLVSTGPPANRWIRVAKRTVAGTDAARDAITALHNHIDSVSSSHSDQCCGAKDSIR